MVISKCRFLKSGGGEGAWLMSRIIEEGSYLKVHINQWFPVNLMKSIS